MGVQVPVDFREGTEYGSGTHDAVIQAHNKAAEDAEGDVEWQYNAVDVTP